MTDPVDDAIAAEHDRQQRPSLTSYVFDIRNGLPPDGELGLWYGFTATMKPYILKWHESFKCWAAVSHSDDREDMGTGLFCQNENVDYIRSHARAPYVFDNESVGASWAADPEEAAKAIDPEGYTEHPPEEPSR